MNLFGFSGLFLLSVATLAACSELQNYNSGGFAPVISGGSGVNNWLVELHDIRTMSPEQQQLTLETRQQECNSSPDSGSCLRLAMLLATGDAPLRDQKRALNLLDNIDSGQFSASEQELVAILLQFLVQQTETDNKINLLSKQIVEQNKRIEELEQQQRALTTIEQSIQQREKPAGVEGGD